MFTHVHPERACSIADYSKNQQNKRIKTQTSTGSNAHFFLIYTFYWRMVGLSCDRCTARRFSYTYPHMLFLKLFSIIGDYSEKAMAPHSSTLAWKIPWMEEPGGLQSMRSQRAGHDWATSLSLFTFMHWRRIWQPAPLFLPGESQGRGSLVGCCLWGCTESDTTAAT